MPQSPPAPLRFFVDDMGYLWAGPINGPTGICWKRFEGVQIWTLRPIWKRYKAIALPAMEEVTIKKAVATIGHYMREAKRERDKEIEERQEP